VLRIPIERSRAWQRQDATCSGQPRSFRHRGRDSPQRHQRTFPGVRTLRSVLPRTDRRTIRLRRLDTATPVDGAAQSRRRRIGRRRAAVARDPHRRDPHRPGRRRGRTLRPGRPHSDRQRSSARAVRANRDPLPADQRHQNTAGQKPPNGTAGYDKYAIRVDHQDLTNRHVQIGPGLPSRSTKSTTPHAAEPAPQARSPDAPVRREMPYLTG
jgi:hypothetical protein